ncbi:MAG: tetratricopeptide repeat protein [Myxococcota bacterium]
MLVDEVAEQALAALRAEDPQQAREALSELLNHHPERIDLRHALSVTLLRMGEARPALNELNRAIREAMQQADERAAAMMSQLHLARASACEDLQLPADAEESYRLILTHEEDHPRAMQGLAHLLMSWGRAPEGISLLAEYANMGGDGPEFARAARDFVDAAQKFLDDDIHPRNFLEAHRGVYTEFFDHHAERMEQQGWIAEAARMQRLADGQIVPVIPEGARPYAAVRMDLVDPQTSQPGQVGDQPMVAGLAGFEPLARASVVTDWPGHDFPVFVSSICPWNWLPIQIRIGYNSDPDMALDETIGQWYADGYNGAFGSETRGRLHSISTPEQVEDLALLYYVDMGRCEVTAIDTLLERLKALHGPFKIDAVLIGRGYLPLIPETLPPEVAAANSGQ